MTNYREILRLSSLGLNKSQIAQSIGCSRTTVIQVLNIAEEKGVCYPLPTELTDRKLAELLFPSDKSRPGYKMPDYEYDRKLRRLEELEAAHPEYASPLSPTKRIGGEAVSAFQKVRHAVPLESLQDVFSF